MEESKRSQEELTARKRISDARLAVDHARFEASKALHEAKWHGPSDQALQRLQAAHAAEDLAVEEYMQALRAFHELLGSGPHR